MMKNASPVQEADQSPGLDVILFAKHNSMPNIVNSFTQNVQQMQSIHCKQM